ncbi:Cytochrome [Abeliophyllum distichum]|uniref:Cytochrome n=1 Tax=Abeliophyllum distichum TaxID=126358 RepID=A0ABD1PNC2_9LAMI
MPNIAKKNLPPSPPKLPIIGNLHQLGSLPHRSLRFLAQKHGPLMLLHFGSTPVLVVSSADAARECKTHDLDLAYRPKVEIVEQMYYNMKSLVSSPYGEYWRQARSIFVHQLLSKRKVQSFNVLIKEEISLLMNKIKESSPVINLSLMFTSLSNDVICRSAFGRKYIETEAGMNFVRVMSEGQELLTNFSIGEFIPWLSWINILNGVSIDMDGIKALIKDVFGAGTETTSAFLEWTMTELLRHPTIMKKLQSEVRGILHDKQDITVDDLERMHYLKAVIKETLRYQPPIPLIPREAGKDVKIMGYDIAAGTIVIINALAIGRDPLFWDEPDKFEPERFLNSSIDFKGLHFQYIPFGSGRRIFPGIGFATALIELVLANILHKFDWELPDGAKGGNLDTTEICGVIVGRKNPLLAVAIPRDF